MAKRLNLPEDKNPRALLRLLRKYRGLSKYMAGDSREPIHFGELYDFCKEIVSKWTLNDVDDLIKTMCHYMQLNRKEAVAKIVADLAFEYILLYEFFQGIPNHFEKFYDETRSPACVTKLAVLYGIENGNQSDK